MSKPEKPNLAKEAGKLTAFCGPIFAAGAFAYAFAEPKIIGAMFMIAAAGAAWSGITNIREDFRLAQEAEAEVEKEDNALDIPTSKPQAPSM